MKRTRYGLRSIIAFAALVMATAGTVRADEATEPPGKPAAAVPEAPAEPAKEWSVTVAADWFSEYIFRGIDLLNNDPVFVPSVVGKWKGLTAYYVGYYGDSDFRNNKWYEETDLGADWTQTILDGKLSLTAGGLYYVYLDGISGTDTWELYGKATWNCYVNPYIGINYDIDEFHGGYGVAGISHAYDLTKPLGLPDGMALSIVPSAQLGIDFGYNSRKTDHNIDWNDVLLGVNVPFNITPQLAIHAQFQASIALNSVNNFYNAAGSSKGNELIGNIGVSYTF